MYGGGCGELVTRATCALGRVPFLRCRLLLVTGCGVSDVLAGLLALDVQPTVTVHAHIFGAIFLYNDERRPLLIVDMMRCCC